jgi:hypothetical protein
VAGRHSGGRAASVVVLVAITAGLLVPLPPALATPLADYAFDFLHPLLLAAVFLALRVFTLGLGARAEPVAAVLPAAAGALTEILQAIGARDGSWSDFGFDVLGIALAWSGLACWRRGRRWAAGHGAVVLAVVLVASALITRKERTLDQLQAMMPLLAGFEQAWELDRWHAKPDTQMVRTRRGAIAGGWSLEVSCSNRAPYPGVSIEEFDGDWRPYRWLEWSVRLPSAEPLELSVRLDDDQGARYGTRYTSVVRVVPGQQTYRIDLREVAAHFRAHPMNMARVTELHFFLDEPRTPRVFLIDDVRLVAEPGR